MTAKQYNKITELKQLGDDWFKCGVYILVIDTLCIYIGLSKSLGPRIKRFFNKKQINSMHYNPTIITKLLNNSQDVVVYVYTTVDLDMAILLEQALIKKYKPYINKEYADIDARHQYSILLEDDLL